MSAVTIAVAIMAYASISLGFWQTFRKRGPSYPFFDAISAALWPFTLLAMFGAVLGRWGR